MSVVQNVITPIIQLAVYLFMIIGVCWLLVVLFRNLFPNFKWAFKYKVLRANYNEKDVEWCMDAVERGMNPVEVKKYLLIHGTPMKKVKETVYIFSQIQRKMKGGAENGRE